MHEENNKSSHILNTSATLMGLCFIVITSLKINDKLEKSYIDELTAVAIMMFMSSCVLSFLAIRTSKKLNLVYEKYADYIFLVGLALLFIITLQIIFNFI